MFNIDQFYNFIVYCFTKEAEEYNCPIYLDYSFSNNLVADIYLPKGLPILNTDRPSVIEIVNKLNKRIFANHLKKMEQNDNFDFLFFVAKENDLTISEAHSNKIVIKILGEDFIARLIDKYNALRYKELFNNEDNQIQFIVEGDSNYIESILKGEKDIERIKEKKNVYFFNKREPEDISEANENEFKAFLGDCNQNNCALFLGNGISIPFGSDLWPKMIDNLLDYLCPYFIEKVENVKSLLANSSYAIASFVKSNLMSKSKYNEAIRYCVYRKYNPSMHSSISAIKVIAEAKRKFRKLPILTYNYDTFVERQYYQDFRDGNLSYFNGDPGNLDNKNIIESIADSNVIHLHGYTSYSRNNTKGIILTDEDYFNAYLTSTSWVRALQVKVLQEYKCLFIGSSMSDLFQMSLIAEARKLAKGYKWKCYALMCFKNLSPVEKMRMISFYGSKGIQIVFCR